MSCQLYRHFDSLGKLLYIGISLSAVERLRRHKQSRSRWFDSIRVITIERYPNRRSALRAEIAAIKAELPPFNYIPPESPKPLPLGPVVITDKMRAALSLMGRAGGLARKKSLSAKRRSEIARMAGSAPKKKRRKNGK